MEYLKMINVLIIYQANSSTLNELKIELYLKKCKVIQLYSESVCPGIF